MSYANKKIRVFREAGDREIQRKRSDGRMKRYTSATDARAWCEITEDRRQHILELIREGFAKDLSLGKYIPIEAIIDILLANKNADIKRLQREIEELRRFIKANGLHHEEKPIEVTEPLPEAEPVRPGPVAEDESGAIQQPIDRKKSSEAESGVGKPDAGGVGAEEVAAEEVAVEEVAVEEVAPEEVAPEEVAVEEVAPKEVAVEEVAPEEIAPEEVATEEVRSRRSDAEEVVAAEAAAVASPEVAAAVVEPDEVAVRALKTSASLKSTTSPTRGYSSLTGVLARDVKKGQASKSSMLRKSASAAHGYGSLTGLVPEGVAVRASKMSGTRRSLTSADEIGASEEEVVTARAFPEGAAPEDLHVIESPLYPPVSEEDEKAAQQLLAGKSPEDQLLALKYALADAEAFYQNQNTIALEAIEMLESIKDIVDGGDGIKRSPLQVRQVKPLEKELSGLGNLEQREFKEEAQALGDENDLRKRLDAQHNLEEEVKALRDRAAAAGDSSERDELLRRIADLEGENSGCLCKMKELEICKVEKDFLNMRIDDLSKFQEDYEDLLKQTQGLDTLKAECAMYRDKYEEVKDLESECNELRSKVQRCKELENERRNLMDKIEDCECCMNHQDDEIKRLTCHIDCLTQDLDKKQDQMNVEVLTMKSHIERKDGQIAKSEQKVADAQGSLRSSMEKFSCERTCLQNRIDEFEDEIIEYQKMLTSNANCQSIENLKNALKEKNKALEENVKSLQSKIDALENNNRCLEESNKALLENLESEKATNAKLEEALKKAIKNDVHLKQMLKQAKCAVKCIAQKLEKQDFIGTGRLEAERQNYMKKIKELEEGMGDQLRMADRIAKLEEELNLANDTIKCLRYNLDKLKDVMDENDTLRKKLLEKTKELEEGMADHLRRADRIAELEEELMKAYDTIKGLRDNLDQLRRVMDETDTLCKNYLNRIKELEEKVTDRPCGAGRIAELEEELMKANAANRCMRGNLDQVKGVMDENETLHKNYLKRIKELEERVPEKPCGADRIAELEQELMKANVTNKCLRGNQVQVKNAMFQGASLRKSSLNCDYGPKC